MSVKIKRIKIDIDGRVLELTKRQAVELKGILNDLYGGSGTVYIDRYPSEPWVWTYDQWTWTNDETRADTGLFQRLSLGSSYFWIFVVSILAYRNLLKCKG